MLGPGWVVHFLSKQRRVFILVLRGAFGKGSGVRVVEEALSNAPRGIPQEANIYIFSF